MLRVTLVTLLLLLLVCNVVMPSQVSAQAGGDNGLYGDLCDIVDDFSDGKKDTGMSSARELVVDALAISANNLGEGTVMLFTEDITILNINHPQFGITFLVTVDLVYYSSNDLQIIGIVSTGELMIMRTAYIDVFSCQEG